MEYCVLAEAPTLRLADIGGALQLAGSFATATPAATAGGHEQQDQSEGADDSHDDLNTMIDK
jgi:hypothetical protein